MTKREEYEKKTEHLLLPILEKNNFELVDVEYVREGGNYFLRAFIDKEGGITLNDCEIVSRNLSDLLDQKDFIPDSYVLEVSSPGLDRPLKKDKDLERSIGSMVEVKLYKPLNKCKDFTGTLAGFNGEKLFLEQGENEKLEFDRSNLAMVRLFVEF